MATDAEWAWAAGFYEGEGSLLMHGQNTGLSFQIGQKNPEPLEKFQKIAECGKIYGPYTNTTPGRVVYSYRVTKTKDVHRIVSNIWPWLSVRRQEQIASLIERRAELRARIVV